MSDYYKFVFDYIKQMFDLEEEHYFRANDKSVLAKIKNGTIKYPVVRLHDCDKFIVCTNQDKIDLKNEIRTGMALSVEIITQSIDDTVNFEETIKRNVSIPESLSAVSENRCTRFSSISLNNDVKISRKNGKEYGVPGTYKTIIPIKITDIILTKSVENPIKIELNEEVQLPLMKHLSLLDEMHHEIQRQIAEILESDNLKNLPSVEEKIESMNSNAKLRYHHLIKQREDLEAQVLEMYTFEELCEEKLLLSEHGFKTCYEIMLNEKCNISNASSIYVERKKEAKKKAEEKAKKIKKEKLQFERNVKETIRIIFPQGNDDTFLNSYVDAIIEDMYTRFPKEQQVYIYGGSSFLDWVNLYDRKEVTLPTILVFANTNYSFAPKTYTNIKADGQQVVHQYSTTAFPIEFGIRIDILTQCKEDTKNIEQQLRKIYGAEPLTVYLHDNQFPDEKCSVKISVTKESSAHYANFESWNGDISHALLYSSRYPSVYYLHEFDEDEALASLRLQFRMLQQAQFALGCFNKINFESIKQLDLDYKTLFNGKNDFFGIFYSPEYKRLKACIKNRIPIERNVFDSAFNKITDVYPLYDKMMSGMTYEQIKEELEGYTEYFAQIWLNICNLLELPEHLGLNTNCINRSDNVRSYEGLGYCINCMAEEGNPTIEDAVDSYEEFLEEELEKYYEKQEQRQEYREQNSGSSSSGGFLSSMLRTAGGVALGNKVSGANSRNKTSSKGSDGSGRQNLFGSANCEIAQGKSPICSMSCALWWHCTQRGKFKVGH